MRPRKNVEKIGNFDSVLVASDPGWKIFHAKSSHGRSKTFPLSFLTFFIGLSSYLRPQNLSTEPSYVLSYLRPQLPAEKILKTLSIHRVGWLGSWCRWQISTGEVSREKSCGHKDQPAPQTQIQKYKFTNTHVKSHQREVLRPQRPALTMLPKKILLCHSILDSKTKKTFA